MTSVAAVQPNSDSPARVTPRWGWPDIVIGFLGAQVLSAVAFAVFAAFKDVPAADLVDQLSIGEVALLQIPLWAGLLGVPLVATRLRGNGAVIDLGWWMQARDVPLGLLIGVAAQLLLVPLLTLPLIWLTGVTQDDIDGPARDLADKAHGAGVLVLVLVVGVGAPLAEEVFYRGMVQRTLTRHLPIWPSMVIVAIVFAASHGEPVLFPALTGFGLLLSYLAHRTGRLGLNTWTHVGFNLTAVASLLLSR